MYYQGCGVRNNDFIGIDLRRLFERRPFLAAKNLLAVYGAVHDRSDIGTQGLQNGAPKCATMSDGPGRSDGAYPADIVKIVLNFEVAAFCSAGQNKGEFLGTMTWTWERPIMGKATATASSGTRNASSQNLIDALSKWNSNHGKKLPVPAPPTSGGEPCT